MNTMTVKEAEKHFKDLVQSVRDGQTIVLIEGGIELATIVPSHYPSKIEFEDLSDRFAAFRQTIKSGISVEEILDWRHEGHRR